MVQEPVGGEIENDVIAVSPRQDFMHHLDRHPRLALGGAKTGEVMLTREALSRARHRIYIQRLVIPTRSPERQRWPYRMVVQQVAIAAGNRAESRVKIRRDRLRP